MNNNYNNNYNFNKPKNPYYNGSKSLGSDSPDKAQEFLGFLEKSNPSFLKIKPVSPDKNSEDQKDKGLH